jgi:hypothetical protein
MIHEWLERARIVLTAAAVAAVCAAPVACASLGTDRGGQECHKSRGMPECR